MDISYHPVDVELLHQRIIPYVTGQSNIDDLVERAVRCARVRRRANDWGLGALELDHQISDAQHQVTESMASANKPGLISRLFGSKRQQTAPQIRTIGIPGFESDLYVWGRPFFITMAGHDAVSDAIDHYLAAEDDPAVDAIANRMLESLDANQVPIPDDLPSPIREAFERLTPSIVQSVRRSEDTPDVSDDELIQSIRWKLDLFRKCYPHLETGETVTDDDGNSHNPRELFKTDFLLAAMEFVAILRPGWMARGNVWPTLLLDQAGIDHGQWFEKPTLLVEPLMDKFPDIAEGLHTTVMNNYMVGGMVPAERVGELIDVFESRTDELIAQARSEQWEDDARLCLGKILEAAYDAHRRGLPFAEATEVYSAPMGMIN